MDTFNYFTNKIRSIINGIATKEQQSNLANLLIQVDIPKEKRFGDLSTNGALVASKILQTNPIELATKIADELKNQESNNIIHIEVVNPGFINFILSNKFWHNVLDVNLKNPDSNWENIGKSKTVNIEYVSANPTGPMHVGHGRGAVIGDVLANLYTYWGFKVTKEYYINDAGNQIQGLALSLYYRYCELFGEITDKPTDFYPGEYIVEAAKLLKLQDHDKWLNNNSPESVEYLKNFAVEYMLNIIKADLIDLGVKHDNFVSEKVISSNEEYTKLKDKLLDKQLLYMGIPEKPKGSKKVLENKEQNTKPSLLFKTTLFGDTDDRVVEKTDGTRTYFANDIVYHYDKIKRGFTYIINLLGADHKGYQKRLEAVVKALSNGKVNFDTIFVEMVNLLNHGEVVKMSKRAGTFVTLRSVLNDVPKDAFRIMMISRSNTSVLDFDISSLLENNENNPVYYIQYAYARINSVINSAKKDFANINEEVLINSDKSLLTHEAELDLIKQISTTSKVLKSALYSNNIHIIFILLLSTAKKLHYLWNVGKNDANLKFVIKNNKNLTFARLSLLLSVQKTMNLLFNLIGIDKIQRM